MLKRVTSPDLADPVTRIEWVDAAALQANSWNPNVVFKPELRLLERSILRQGWIQPILVNAGGIIIDGWHRATLAHRSEAIRKRYRGAVPAVVLDVSDADAKAVTVRINRAKGQHDATRMSSLVQSLVNDHGWDEQQVAEEIGAEPIEVQLLLQASIFKAKKLEAAPFSRAWVPREGKPPVKGQRRKTTKKKVTGRSVRGKPT